MNRLAIFLGFALFLVFFIVNLLILPDYGINWDEPAHYLRGQAYLRYFLTGQDTYTDLPKLKFHYPKFNGYSLPNDIAYNDDKFFRRSIYQYDREGERGKFTYNWYLSHDTGHPPLNGIMASFFNFILYQKLGVVGDIESYHVFTLLISSVLALTVFLFTARLYGMFAAFVAFFSLTLYPIFFSESHFNVKDPIESTFYALAIIALYLGITKNNWKWIMFCAISSGLALGTKFNIFFAAFSVIPWIFIYKWKEISHFKWPFKKNITIGLLFIPLIAFAIFFLSWPYLWKDSFSHFLSIVSYYKEIGSISYQVNDDIFFYQINTYALRWVLYTTPLVILFFAIIGIIYTLTIGLKEKNKTSLLVLLWVVVPIARVSMPNSGIYGGVRQIMEYIPAMAILCGIGASYLAIVLNRLIGKQFQKSTLALKVILLLSFIPITLKLISIHPNENVYFNPLIGGLKGASVREFPDWGMTLGSVYKQGMDWINTNAELYGNVALVRGLSSNVPRIKIREDINFYEKYYSDKEKRGEYLMEVVDYRWNLDTPKQKRVYIETLVSIYEVKVDDVAILRVWKNDKKHLKTDY